jgi:uncharacterized membrane protein
MLGYYEAVMLQTLVPITVILVIFALLMHFFTPRKSKSYRRDLTNLYVAGKIKQVADKEGINLTEEFENFKKYCKKKKMEDWSLDYVIEEDLKDQINDKEKEKKGK